MSRRLPKTCVVAAVFSLVGCNRDVGVTPALSEPILGVIRAQMDAMNREDLAGAMSAIDPSGPGYQQTKDVTAQMFQTYDLRYRLEDLAVESVSGDEARVRFRQITEKVSGPAFRNNRLTGTHILRKVNGEWKLVGTETSNIEFLDQ